MVIAANWRLAPFLLQWSNPAVFIVVAMLLVLLLSSVVGLLTGSSWGYIAAYLLIPYATLFHGVSLVPFVTRWLPVGIRPAATFIANLMVLSLVVLSHLAARRESKAKIAPAVKRDLRRL